MSKNENTKLTIVRVPYNFANEQGENIEGVTTKMRYYYGSGSKQYIEAKVPKDYIAILNFLYPDIMESEELAEKTLLV